MKTLGARYEESRLTRSIEKSIANRKPPKSLDEINDDVMQEYSCETRKLIFVRGVQDDLETLNRQLNNINTWGINSISEVEPLQTEHYSELMSQLRKQEHDYPELIIPFRAAYPDGASGREHSVTLLGFPFEYHFS